MKGRQIIYSAAELAFCEARQSMPRRELHASFVAAFGRDDVSAVNFKAMCTRKGWKTGRSGCFPKGNAPFNKGKPHPPTGRAAQTQFKKGREPHNTNYLGHKRVSKDGYVEISIAAPNPYTGYERRYVLKHRHLWELANGPVPEGMALKCLGDRANTDPANWTLISRAILPRLNGGRGKKHVAYDEAPAELKPAILAVAKLDHSIREKRRGAA